MGMLALVLKANIKKGAILKALCPGITDFACFLFSNKCL